MSARGCCVLTELSWILVRLTPSPHPQPLRSLKSDSQHHSTLLMELCTLTPDWVTTNTWLWFRGLTRRPPLCTALSSSSSSSAASTLLLSIAWCCDFVVHCTCISLRQIKRKQREKEERCGSFLDGHSWRFTLDCLCSYPSLCIRLPQCTSQRPLVLKPLHSSLHLSQKSSNLHVPRHL